MARKFRNKILLAKIETEYGDDSVPTGAANAILTRDLTIELMQGPTAEREIDRASYGHFQMFHTGPHTAISFRVEMAGSGTATVAPAYGPLLRACGLQQIEPELSDWIEYKPVSANEESVTLYYWHDGVQHKILGCRGSVSIQMTPGELPYFSFRFTGLRDAPTDVETIAGVSYAAFKQPQAVNAAHSGDFSFDSYEGTLTEFSIDLAQEVVYRNVIGEESVQITDRRPTGSFVIEEPLLDDYDFHALVACHGTGALTIRHGAEDPCEDTPSEAGKVIEISAPRVQLVQPVLGDSQGIVTIQAQMRLLPTDAGNDELLIKVR